MCIVFFKRGGLLTDFISMLIFAVVDTMGGTEMSGARSSRGRTVEMVPPLGPRDLYAVVVELPCE